MRSLLDITSSDPIVDTIPVTWLRQGSGQGLCLGLRESRFVVTKAMQKRRCRYDGPVALVVLRPMKGKMWRMSKMEDLVFKELLMQCCSGSG